VLLSVAPIFPGTAAVFVAALGICALEGWSTFPWWFWILQIVLGVAYFAIDNVAQALGVKRAGGSNAAMVGGAIGVFAGPLLLAPVLGVLAAIVGPPIGAVAGTIVGEMRARRQAEEGVAPVAFTPGVPPPATYRRLGVIAFIAFVVSILAKLAVISVQLTLLAILAL